MVGLLLLAGLAATPAGSAERGPLKRGAAAQSVETEGRVIVKFKADSAMMRALAASRADRPRQAGALAGRMGLTMRDGHALGAHTQVLIAKGIGSRELAARLSAQSDVEFAEVDERVRAFAAPNDPLYLAAPSPAAGQWYLRTPNPTFVSSVNAEAAWAITTGNDTLVVAVLDTGVRFEHPDLAGKLLAGYDFIGGAGSVTSIATANDGDARDANPEDPGDGVVASDVGTIEGCNDADIGPSSWHGTQTAGLVGAATHNAIGMAGLGRDVKVLPVRVLGKCGGYSSDIQAAMLWSAGIGVPGVPANPNKASVINLSLGSAGPCSTGYQSAVNQVLARGVVVVAAAGNEGLTVGSPANCTGVIGVAGVRHSGTKVGYSNLGPLVSISAPAGNCFNASGACLYPLLTTGNNGVQGPGASTYTDGLNDPTLGTSFSSPLVAGTVALMLSANPTLTPAQVLAALKSTARPFPATGAGPLVSACTAPTATAQDAECYCTTSTCGAGLLDAGAAVAAVAVITAHISVVSTTVEVGVPVALDGRQSKASGTASITDYLWAVTSGSATLTSAVNASTATLATSEAGTVVVSLTVTDSAGRQATTSTTLVVTAAPGTIPDTPAPSSGGGGGGALNLEWLLTLVASTLALHLVSRRQRRAAPLH